MNNLTLVLITNITDYNIEVHKVMLIVKIDYIFMFTYQPYCTYYILYC